MNARNGLESQIARSIALPDFLKGRINEIGAHRVHRRRTVPAEEASTLTAGRIPWSAEPLRRLRGVGSYAHVHIRKKLRR